MAKYARTGTKGPRVIASDPKSLTRSRALSFAVLHCSSIRNRSQPGRVHLWRCHRPNPNALSPKSLGSALLIRGGLICPTSQLTLRFITNLPTASSFAIPASTYTQTQTQQRANTLQQTCVPSSRTSILSRSARLKLRESDRSIQTVFL